ncbi:MAG TPA: cytochrome c [Elusimicrobiota bacterium]|jgi:mono/diheme cytochrome c family protein|nr:cytochrome c [Elusimicrobiota bacterium]HMX43927.1 cytochrome c [Elusimicrobiota bacterium]HMX94574.1 cytochrome c [Elusimicrobiota bacterium]HMZ27301.1 cytochrome c [Elusimicrobiota bacterium]HNA59686.1 cytochrome c [Elusimicrobiota bacterium]
MKRLSLLLGVLTLLAAVAGAEDAAKLYGAKCAGCHGKDGKGNAVMVKALKVDLAALSLVDAASLAKKDEEWVKLTLDGQGKMPAQKGKIKDEDVKALVAYVRGLAPKSAQ